MIQAIVKVIGCAMTVLINQSMTYSTLHMSTKTMLFIRLLTFIDIYYLGSPSMTMCACPFLTCCNACAYNAYVILVDLWYFFSLFSYLFLLWTKCTVAKVKQLVAYFEQQLSQQQLASCTPLRPSVVSFITLSARIDLKTIPIFSLWH